MGVKKGYIYHLFLVLVVLYVRIFVIMLTPYWKKALKLCVYFFALIGFLLTVGFFAVKFHLTDSEGLVDFNDRYFSQSAGAINALAKSNDRSTSLDLNLCKVQVIKKIYPENAGKILTTYERTRSDIILAQMLSASEIYLLNNKEYQKEIKKCSAEESSIFSTNNPSASNLYAWINTPEWQTLKEGLAKDKEIINSVAVRTGVPARLIVAQVVGEQLRLFHTEREVYKQFFQPLKILGNEVKFSLGVAGIKEETAITIEKNLNEQDSPFYLGSELENILSFETADINQERFERLTNADDHTYSYLYTALFLKQIQMQWKRAGFDISARPEILATIFNIGFTKSIPKEDPQVGGSEIEIADRKYTFGALAYEFYFSGEMLDEFGF